MARCGRLPAVPPQLVATLTAARDGKFPALVAAYKVVVAHRVSSAASWVRLAKSSFVNTCERYVSTVRREMYRRSPISGFVNPSATSWLTVVSNGVSGSHPMEGRLACRRVPRSPRSRRAVSTRAASAAASTSSWLVTPQHGGVADGEPLDERSRGMPPVQWLRSGPHGQEALA
jgi:hypothetical protein